MLEGSAGDEVRADFRDDLDDAWYVIGDIQYRNHDYTGAVPVFSHSIDQRFDDLEAILALGNAYSQLENHELCEEVLRQGLAFDPQHDHLLYNLGNALFDPGITRMPSTRTAAFRTVGVRHLR